MQFQRISLTCAVQLACFVAGASPLTGCVAYLPEMQGPDDGTAGMGGENASQGATATEGESPLGGASGSPKSVDASSGTGGNMDAGVSPQKMTPDSMTAASTPPTDYVWGAVAVGSGGMRLLSRNGGKNWIKAAEINPNGGDDHDLIRSLTYGHNLWIAGGWDKWWTSQDGLMWTQRDHKFGIIQGLAYGNEMFVATIIDGKVLRSTDGIAWTPAGDSGAGSHTRVVFGNGQFAASGDKPCFHFLAMVWKTS